MRKRSVIVPLVWAIAVAFLPSGATAEDLKPLGTWTGEAYRARGIDVIYEVGEGPSITMTLGDEEYAFERCKLEKDVLTPIQHCIANLVSYEFLFEPTPRISQFQLNTERINHAAGRAHRTTSVE